MAKKRVAPLERALEQKHAVPFLAVCKQPLKVSKHQLDILAKHLAQRLLHEIGESHSVAAQQGLSWLGKEKVQQVRVLVAPVFARVRSSLPRSRPIVAQKSIGKVLIVVGNVLLEAFAQQIVSFRRVKDKSYEIFDGVKHVLYSIERQRKRRI